MELRPLTLGGQIDRAARVWRQHWSQLFLMYLPFQLILYILLKSYTALVKRFFPRAAPGSQVDSQQLTDALSDVFRSLLALGPTMLTYWLVSCFAAVAAGAFFAPRMLGATVTVRDGLTRLGRRIPSLLAAETIVALWGVFGIAAAVVPGAALALVVYFAGAERLLLLAVGIAIVTGSFGMIVVMLWWVLRFLLLTQVLASEDVAAWGAIRRSGQLMKGRVLPGWLGWVRLRAAVLLTAAVAILWTAQLLTSIPQLALHALYANPFDPSTAGKVDAIPAVLLIPAELLQVVAQATLAPLYVAICASFYVDLRCRKEGLDLQLRLQALAAK